MRRGGVDGIDGIGIFLLRRASVGRCGLLLAGRSIYPPEATLPSLVRRVVVSGAANHVQE